MQGPRLQRPPEGRHTPGGGVTLGQGVVGAFACSVIYFFLVRHFVIVALWTSEAE